LADELSVGNIGDILPVAFEHVYEKELDSGKADAHGGGGPFVCIFSMEEILLEVGFGDFIRSFSEELCNHAHGAGISFLGALAHAGELKGFHGLGVVILGHDNSPFVDD
jgi:hypothetical protein